MEIILPDLIAESQAQTRTVTAFVSINASI